MPDPAKARPELVPDPVTLTHRFEAVEKNLYELRNKIIGRGVTPISSNSELVDHVGMAQETWLRVRDDILGAIPLHPYDASEALEGWERKVNELADAAIASGLPGGAENRIEVTHTATSSSEVLKVLDDRLSLAGDLVKGLAVIGIGLGGVYLFSKMTRGR